VWERVSETDRQIGDSFLCTELNSWFYTHTHTHTHTYTCTARKFSSSGRILYVWTCFWNLDRHTQRQIYHVDEMKLGQQLDWLFNCNHTHTHTHTSDFHARLKFSLCQKRVCVCVCVCILLNLSMSVKHTACSCARTHTHLLIVNTTD